MASEPKQIIQFPLGGAVSPTDVMLVQQGPEGTPMSHIPLSALAQEVIRPAGEYLTEYEPLTADLILTGEDHVGKALTVTLANTFVSYGTFASLGEGFNVSIYNRSSTNIGFSAGIGNPYGHAYLQPGGVASVVAISDTAGDVVRWFGGPSE